MGGFFTSTGPDNAALRSGSGKVTVAKKEAKQKSAPVLPEHLKTTPWKSLENSQLIDVRVGWNGMAVPLRQVLEMLLKEQQKTTFINKYAPLAEGVTNLL